MNSTHPAVMKTKTTRHSRVLPVASGVAFSGTLAAVATEKSAASPRPPLTALPAP